MADPVLQSQPHLELSLITSESETAVKPDKPVIHSLTGLRFYAALLVFFAHTYHVNYFGIHSIEIGNLGDLGVSTFFILSGFVLFLNYPKLSNVVAEKFKTKQFYIARFARVYPAFLFTTLLAIPLELFSKTKTGFWEPLIMTLGMVHCFKESSCWRFNDVGWSLSVEAFFYLVFPILLTVCFPLSRKTILHYLLLVVAFAAAMIFLPKFFFITHRFPPNRVLEFFLGMIIGAAFLKGSFTQPLKKINTALLKKINPWVTLLLSTLLISLPLFVIPKATLYTLDNLVYMFPAAALIIWLASMEKMNLQLPMFSSKLAIYAGEISYSFYLFHNLLLRYMEHGLKIVFHIETKTMSLGYQIMMMGFALILSLAVSAWMYQFIETPWRKKIRNWLGH